MGTTKWWRLRANRTVALLVVAAIGGYFLVNGGDASAGQDAAARPPACTKAVRDQPPPPLKPTTVDAIAQAYYCVLDNYFAGPVLDSRSLLVPAFAALTQELQRRGLEQPTATPPALTGRKDTDWAAFSRVYQQVITKVPDAAARQALAEVTIAGMVGSLNDDHVRWHHGLRHSAQYNIGLSGLRIGGTPDPVATEPVFVTDVARSSPADRAGVKPGDEVVAINGLPPYVNGILSTGVLKWITDNPDGAPVKLTLHRPVTNATIAVMVEPGPPPPPGPAIQSRLVDGGVGYVSFSVFDADLAGEVLAAIAKLRQGTDLRGVVLDLRGNGGGDPVAVTRLVSSFVHGRTFGYFCDVRGKCTPTRTDDSVELLHLPLVVLTDRRCASACDAFSNAAKDLHFGTLVGTRTAGVASGPAEDYLLQDGSVLTQPGSHGLGANKEVIDTIGVAPDYYTPMTAAALSAGRDPGLDKAVALLR
jgi:carboxyl-terminal processing protease